MARRWLLFALIGIVFTVPTIDARAADRFFRPFTWFYEFDGTDATLAGISYLTTNLQHTVNFRFQCSRKQLHLRVYGSDYSDTPLQEGGGRATIRAGDTELSTSWFGGSIHALTDMDKAEASRFAQQFFKLSAGFFHDDARDLLVRLQTKNGTTLDLRYRLQPQSEQYSGKNEIARFREKCAEWWQSML